MMIVLFAIFFVSLQEFSEYIWQDTSILEVCNLWLSIESEFSLECNTTAGLDCDLLTNSEFIWHLDCDLLSALETY